MFERFTRSAREVVIRAQEEARRSRRDQVAAEHLLLGLLGAPEQPGSTVLADAGMTLAEVRSAVEAARTTAQHDAEALQHIGIDLDRVRRAVEGTFGDGALERRGRRRSGHIPFSRAAKKALELSLREALRLGDRHIGTEHLLLGLMRGGDPSVASLLADARVDRTAVEAALPDRQRDAG